MRQVMRVMLVPAAVALLTSPVGAQGAKPLTKCAPDAVVAGTVCMDRYEASVWRVPLPTTANKGLVKKIRAGKATAADLAKGGATQLGIGVTDDYAPCADSGQNCADDIYAVSLLGVPPSANMTWFQAQAACKNARKRLPSNAEWQAAVVGTPDPGGDNGTTDCNSATISPSLTGSRSSCKSADGAFDMVGNLDEWVADWVPQSTACPNWGSFSNDFMCLSGASTTAPYPGALLRGGDFAGGFLAGPLAVAGSVGPSGAFFNAGGGLGFRCAR